MFRKTPTRRHFLQNALAAAAVFSAAPELLAQSHKVRLALSMEMIASGNLNDSRAAYRVWGDQLIHRFGLHQLEILPEIIYPSARLLQMIRTNQVDCFTLSALEMARVTNDLDLNSIAVEDYAAHGMEYLLLVHASSSYRSLEDLRNTRFLLQQHRDNALIMPWVELQLASLHQPSPETFFESVETRARIHDVILPLFFRKVHAIVLTRRAFNLAMELNPQLGRDLRILATSPRLVVDAFLFRKGVNAEDQRSILKALTNMGTVPAGQQLLALYESGGFTVSSGQILTTTLELARQYEHLHKS